MSEESYEEGQPPILNSWKQLYWAVLIIHALIITAFYLFTHHFS